MIFKSRIFEEIVTEGPLMLKAERKFGWFGNCDVKIYLADTQTMSFHINGTTDKVSKVVNGLDYPYELVSRNKAVSGDDQYFITNNRNYLFSGNYGELLINGQPKAKLLLKQKLFGIELTMLPLHGELDQDVKLKSAILIMANIADLDGSSP